MSFRKFVMGGRTFCLPALALTLFVAVVICLSAVKCNENEFYSSVAGLESLLKTEQILVADLKDYVRMTKQQIAIFEKYKNLPGKLGSTTLQKLRTSLIPIQITQQKLLLPIMGYMYHYLQLEILKIENDHNLAENDTDNYLTNPVNAYKLINRLYHNWDKYEDQISEAFNFIKLLHDRRTTLAFPSEDDFEESALALVRLQRTYNLEVAQVASGMLNGIKYGSDMSWSDCLMLGEQLIQLRAYNQTKSWMKESVKRLNFDTFHENKVSLEFMEILVENLLKIGDVDSALNVVKLILNQDPLRQQNLAKIIENTKTIYDVEVFEREYHATNEYKLYEKVCREEVQQSPSQQRNLKCRYHSGNCAFCRLAPFKVEDLSLDPVIMLFHDMITDERIDKIVELALPKMVRSTVREGQQGKKRNYRISKNAWLPYDTHPYMLQMLRDLHDVTGLDMTYSEQLQVANYGLGGHYEPHFDFFLQNIPEDEGNRISTSIFYLSDVEQGGATAFPFLKIAVKPAKGNVLFWYNLHRSLDGDFRTKHAGCPVLKGSKWIGNVWTHDRKQDVIRPCGLVRDYESSLEYEIVN